MRMIDKDEAIKILCDGCTADCDVPYTACITVQKIIDMPTIEAEPVRHGGWIPCSERLPENDAKCLVYFDRRVAMARWYGNYDEQGAWYIISDDVPKLYRIKNVPYWMPLPAPPEVTEP